MDKDEWAKEASNVLNTLKRFEGYFNNGNTGIFARLNNIESEVKLLKYKVALTSAAVASVPTFAAVLFVLLKG